MGLLAYRKVVQIPIVWSMPSLDAFPIYRRCFSEALKIEVLSSTSNCNLVIRSPFSRARSLRRSFWKTIIRLFYFPWIWICKAAVPNYFIDNSFCVPGLCAKSPFIIDLIPSLVLPQWSRHCFGILRRCLYAIYYPHTWIYHFRHLQRPLIRCICARARRG